MLNSSTDKGLYHIPMPTFKDCIIVDSHVTKGSTHKVIMTSITEEQENILDKDGQLTLDVNGLKCIVNKNNVYCYGVVDFTKGSDDLKEIAKFTFLDYRSDSGVVIPASYDYEKHECVSKKPFYMITETFKPDVLVKYKHACINKPERIVLFLKK